MITVDSRVGSKELLGYLPKSLAVEGRLEYADAAFSGSLNGEYVSVGVERKALSDFLSSMQDGRLAGHQLIGLQSCYDVVYIIVEGVWRLGPKGELQVPRGKGWRQFCLGPRPFMMTELEGFINTLQTLTGCLVRETRTMRHTAVWLKSVYNWYQKDDHRSHMAIHKNRFREGVQLTRPTFTRRVAAEISGVGWKRSKDVAKRFHSVKEMCDAGVKEWMSIPGIGKITAERAVKELNGGG